MANPWRKIWERDIREDYGDTCTSCGTTFEADRQRCPDCENGDVRNVEFVR